MTGEYHTLNTVVRTLAGHSGCQLQLLQTDKEVIVRKIASSYDYNDRLEAQCRKQREYISTYLKVPLILGTGYINKLFFFDMEYVQGVQLSEYVRRIQLDQCGNFLAPFIDAIPDTITQNQAALSIFTKKLTSLENILPCNRLIEKALIILQETDWSFVPESRCHGDLTFENILIKGNDLYLIDFLDSFYNSWMIDLAKLFQDLELRWSYRKDTIDDNTNIRLLVMRELFTQEIRKCTNSHIIIPLLYKLVILNLLRIIPYIKHERDQIFVYSALERML